MAAYHMVKRLEILLLPDDRMIQWLLSKSLSHDYLGKLLWKLKPEQRLVNILFEVMLKQSVRFIWWHICGHTFNKSEVLATSALVFQVCLKVVPVASIKEEQSKEFLMVVYFLIKRLQRQSVALACQVFNDKTVAAMTSLQTKLHISEGNKMHCSYNQLVQEDEH